MSASSSPTNLSPIDDQCAASLPDWSEADSDQRRQIIIALALDVLHDDGLDAVTIRRLAGDLGLGAMTLYTYLDGQNALRRALVARGFEMLASQGCGAHEESPEGATTWQLGARRYLQFAMDRPNLYGLMFNHPLEDGDRDLLDAGFEPLLNQVALRLESDGMAPDKIEQEARRRAGRYWMGLHSLASIVISGRRSVLAGDLDTLLDDLIERIHPDLA